MESGRKKAHQALVASSHRQQQIPARHFMSRESTWTRNCRRDAISRMSTGGGEFSDQLLELEMAVEKWRNTATEQGSFSHLSLPLRVIGPKRKTTHHGDRSWIGTISRNGTSRYYIFKILRIAAPCCRSFQHQVMGSE
jgi:hypothetical protein